MVHVSLFKQLAAVAAHWCDALQPALPTEEELQRHFLFPARDTSGAAMQHQPLVPMIDRAPSGPTPL